MENNDFLSAMNTPTERPEKPQKESRRMDFKHTPFAKIPEGEHLSSDPSANNAIVLVAEKIRYWGRILAIVGAIMPILTTLIKIISEFYAPNIWPLYTTMLLGSALYSAIAYLLIRWGTWMLWAMTRLFANIAIEAHEINEKMK